VGESDVDSENYKDLLDYMQNMYISNMIKTFEFNYMLILVGLFMVFNATFNNISNISWWSVLLVEETGIPGENHRPVASR